MWHLTCDTWHVTHALWRMVGGEHYLKIWATQLLLFGIDSALKILNKSITELLNDWINYKDVYRTAQASPGLLKSHHVPQTTPKLPQNYLKTASKLPQIFGICSATLP